MKKAIILLMFVLACNSAMADDPPDISGVYESSYVISGRACFYIKISIDGTFEYRVLAPDKNGRIKGTWEIEGDTVYMYSDSFTYHEPEPEYIMVNEKIIRIPDLSESNEYGWMWSRFKKLTTLNELRDGFFIKGDRLYCLTPFGIDEGAYVQKIDRPGPWPDCSFY